MSFIDQIKALSKQLLPTGRAFRANVGGWFDALIYALSISEAKAYSDALSILDSIIPDRYDPTLPDNLQIFTGQDCTDWETRLGLTVYNPDGPNIPLYQPNLKTRYDAILRKMQYPSTFKARTNPGNMQGQLQDAGFDVYVYRNRFFVSGGWTTQNPVTISGGTGLLAYQHGDHQHGDGQHGGEWGDIVANYIDLNQDLLFQVGTNQYFTFFIGGPNLSSPATAYANVPAARMDEFRQLILKFKPIHTVAYLFINYV
jgi:hypothetical protein